MIMIFHRRCLNVPPLTLITGIFIFVLFITKQVKDLYERNQKYYRMENYNKFIDDVSQSMNTLEMSANRSAQALHRLTAVLQKHNARHHRELEPPR